MHAGQELPAVMLELSASGVRLQVDQAPDLSAPLTLAFSAFGHGYCTQLHVIRFVDSRGGGSIWSCRLDLTPDEERRIELAVRATLGLEAALVRAWPHVLADLTHPSSGGRVAVGSTASGQVLELGVTDCLEMGAQGVALYVATVASLERI